MPVHLQSAEAVGWRCRQKNLKHRDRSMRTRQIGAIRPGQQDLGLRLCTR
jgi:hypothetical protein